MKRILLVLALLLAPAVAHAQIDDPDINRGIKQFNDLDYQKSIDSLRRALAKQQNLTKKELTETYKYLAFGHLVLGNDGEAERMFRELLKIDPWYELDPMTSPRFIDFFARVKKSMPPPPKRVATLTATGEKSPVEMTYTTSPAVRAIHEAPLTFGVGIADPEGRHNRIELFHRKRGAPVFSRATARRVDNRRYEIVVPGLLVEPPAVEFYIAAVDDQGNQIGLLGSPEAPLAIDVGEEESRPIYAAWWFWTGIGAVVLGSVVAIALMGGGGGGPGSNTGIVTIQPRPQ